MVNYRSGNTGETEFSNEPIFTRINSNSLGQLRSACPALSHDRSLVYERLMDCDQAVWEANVLLGNRMELCLFG